MRIFSVMLSFFIGLLATAASAQQQVAAISPSDTLVYEVLSEPSPGSGDQKFSWNKSATLEIRLERSANNQQMYRLGSEVIIFDPLSFSLAVSKAPFEMKVSSDKNGTDVKQGSDWKNSFSQPGRSPYCSGDMSLDYKAVADGEKMSKISINGQEVALPAITVLQKGFWSYTGCANGDSIVNVTYSPALQILVSGEFVGYFRGSIFSGAKITLKEIRRGSAVVSTK